MVFPNPAIGPITLQLKTPVSLTARFYVVNELGQELIEDTIKSNVEISFDRKLPSGMYLFVVQTESMRITERVFIGQ